MKTVKTLLLLFIAALTMVNCTKNLGGPTTDSSQNLTRTWSGDYSLSNLTYTSMKKVTGLSFNVSSITPAIDNAKIPYGTAADYLSNSSALGYYGPLGPYGPLATLGPIGDNSWNVSYWISGMGDWSDWSQDMADLDGPLSAAGPLGQNGPVAEAQYYGQADPGATLFATNDFAVHTRGQGIWTPLGPIGPLGALGPLGPLGPVGAHGYAANSNGQYLNNGQVVRNITIPFDNNGTVRSYELVEKYTESFAKSMTNNDTSFMVMGTSSSYSDEDVYTINSASNQLVTVVLVPEKQLDDFDLTILDQNNNVVAVSNTGTFIDWVQLKVPAGKKLKVKVKCYYSGHYLSSTYRLNVTGSTANLNQVEIAGNHISNWQ